MRVLKGAVRLIFVRIKYGKDCALAFLDRTEVVQTENFRRERTHLAQNFAERYALTAPQIKVFGVIAEVARVAAAECSSQIAGAFVTAGYDRRVRSDFLHIFFGERVKSRRCTNCIVPYDLQKELFRSKFELGGGIT